MKAWHAPALALVVLAASVGGAPARNADASALPTTPGFVPLVVPERLLDTRASSQVGYSGGKPRSGAVIQVRVDELGESPSVIDATVLNVTATAPTADGYVTVWPCDEARPGLSNLNLTAGVTSSNMVVSPVSDAGTVCIYTQSSADFIVDRLGFMPPGSAYSPDALRLFDSRTDPQEPGLGGPPRKLFAGETISRRLRSPAGPNDHVAVVLNVTATGSAAAGYVTVWPCDEPQPLASSLNLVPGRTVSNSVVARIGEVGELCFYSQSVTDLVIDLLGYVAPGAYVPLTPRRVLDTRAGAPINHDGIRPRPGDVVEVPVSSIDGGPVPATAHAVILNVTGTDVTAPGYVSVWPCDQPRPATSTLNLEPGVTTPNAALVAISAQGTVCMFTQAGADLIVDVAGYNP